MDLFSELVTAVQSDLTVDSNSTLFPPTTIKLALNRSYRKAGGLFRWPETEDAKKTSSVVSQEYYDYPDNWRPDSVWKLLVDGVDYGDPLVFKDYLYEKENNLPSGLDTMWTNQWRRYFIYPVPTTNGLNNICVWGVKIVDTLVNDNDVTIFSYSMPECNDAIVMEAVAILKNKGEEQNASQFYSTGAKVQLSLAWNKVRQEQQKYEKTQGFFDVSDMFSGRSRTKSKIGNF